MELRDFRFSENLDDFLVRRGKESKPKIAMELNDSRDNSAFVAIIAICKLVTYILPALSECRLEWKSFNTGA
jgi:hypothetical protein